MEAQNSQSATISKHLSNQPVLQCPWTSTAPLTNLTVKNNLPNSQSGASQSTANGHNKSSQNANNHEKQQEVCNSR